MLVFGVVLIVLGAQLFSIGLHELDESGQPRLANGKPVEVYSASDIKLHQFE